ncbi:hypothetical protein CH92_11345 [Stutzerimonas stutzeri]|uniref:DUF2934 domain-containing protein n=1 Tax=Stutzerimonas stutzeri TaxID=316 RepID=W8R7V1_STUST|nr:DUF2934 domain-containing protein [Stutzerimonas stutzeri]AHL75668.1 hypothetical protein CH92_11345 [Stutzerimonas stutzeri]MCQ4327752.1 DUF2934 domain-containing protein [Stutzerimonas stutzeri]
MNKDEKRIREFAYDIWVSEGRPDGQDERHWQMACKLVEAENGKSMEKPASRSRKTATKPTDATPAAKPGKAAKVAKPAQDAKQPTDLKPAKPATAAKSTARPKAKAGTEAAEGTPAGVKKTRAPRAKKDS